MEIFKRTDEQKKPLSKKLVKKAASLVLVGAAVGVGAAANSHYQTSQNNLETELAVARALDYRGVIYKTIDVNAAGGITALVPDSLSKNSN